MCAQRVPGTDAHHERGDSGEPGDLDGGGQVRAGRPSRWAGGAHRPDRRDLSVVNRAGAATNSSRQPVEQNHQMVSSSSRWGLSAGVMAMWHTGSVARVSSWRSAPSSSHRIRSAMSWRRLSWVTMIKARWSSSASARRRRATWRPLAESRLAVGSSARMTAGLLMRALAMATRCFSPPES